MASRPDAARSVVKPAFSRYRSMSCAMSRSSSTIRTRGVMGVNSTGPRRERRSLGGTEVAGRDGGPRGGTEVPGEGRRSPGGTDVAGRGGGRWGRDGGRGGREGGRREGGRSRGGTEVAGRDGGDHTQQSLRGD